MTQTKHILSAMAKPFGGRFRVTVLADGWAIDAYITCWPVVYALIVNPTQAEGIAKMTEWVRALRRNAVRFEKAQNAAPRALAELMPSKPPFIRGLVEDGWFGSAARGLSALARPLGPGVAVGVQANPFDAEARAALLEFRGPVASADRPQIRKERAGLGSPLMILTRSFKAPSVVRTSARTCSASVKCSQIQKERAGLGAALEEGGNLGAEADQGRCDRGASA